VETINVRHHAKLGQFFRFCKMVAVRHLRFFLKLEILTAGRIQRLSVRHRAKFRDNGQTAVETCGFIYFKDSSLPAILDLLCARLAHLQRAFDGFYRLIWL